MKPLFGPAALPALVVLALGACSAGGPDTPGASPAPAPPPSPPPAPATLVLPASFDFGKVTSSNDPAPLEITIANGGNAPLAVSSIAFRAPSDPSFQVRLAGGSEPCGSATPTIGPGKRCTVQVAFDPVSSGTFTSTLKIDSNATNSPALIPITGTAEPVSALTVRINQLQRSCPSDAITAYVSVTDQGGYPVTGLTSGSFSVTQGTGAPVSLPLQATYVDVAYQPIATAAALDFSNSLTSQPVAFADMKNGFSSHFSAMRAGDLGEVVKFGSEVEVTQAFTSDKAALSAAIAAPFDKGGSTKLYDAAVRAVDDAVVQSNARKVVIIATDGADNSSTRTVAEATSYAKSRGVPLFTVGIGGSINADILKAMAADTGGLYYEANTSQNLATIYQQLSSTLYTNQYIVRFDQQPAAGSTLTIGASLPPALPGSSTSAVPACN